MILEKLKPTQGKYIDAFLSGKYQFLLYAGSVNTGKSYIACHMLVQLGIDFPESRFAIIRKSSTVAKRTIYRTLKKVLDEYVKEHEWFSYRENRVDLVITTSNGTTFEFIEADVSKDPELNKIKGLEVTGALLEEANEVAEEVFNLLITRINRWNVNGCPSFILLTCNPSIGWVKKKFKDRYDEGTLKEPFFFQQNEFSEIPFESQRILENLPENEYRRYALGDWNYSDDPAQLITYEWLRNNFCSKGEIANYMGIDAARYGADRTVFAYRQGNSLVNYEVFTKQDTNTTAKIAIERLKEKEIPASHTACDVIGLGAGVVDTMRAQGYYIAEYNAAEAPDQWASTFQFKNRRAQTYWNLREGFQNSAYKVINDPDIIKELTNIRYKVENKCISIETKDDIKKRLGFSCDLADAVCIAYSMDSAVFDVTTGGDSIWREVKTSPKDDRERYFNNKRDDLFKKRMGF
jgi:hypothetical protein